MTDAVIAAVLYALMLTTPAMAPQRPASLSAGYVVAGAVVCGALVFRRRWPLWVLLVTVAGALVHTVAGRSGAAGTPFLVASSLAVFTFVLTSGRSAGLAGGAITAVVLFCADGLWVPGSWWDGCTPGDYRATALAAGSLLPRTGTPS